MDKSSLKGLSKERDIRKKDTTDAVKKLQRTEVDVVKVANQLGAIRSELSDVQEIVRDKSNRILDAAGKAGSEDQGQVEVQEKKASTQRATVEGTEQRTKNEQRKAESVKPADRRIPSGTDVAKALRDAGAKLQDISRDLRATEVTARERRTKARAQMEGALRKNRK